MTRTPRHQDEAPGYDSFLDIVANLVGILVILIMVIGVRAKNAWDASAGRAEPRSQPVALPDVETPKADLARLASEIAETNRRAHQIEVRLAEQQVARNRLQQQISSKTTELGDRRRALTAAQRGKDLLDRRRTTAQHLLAGLRRKGREAESLVTKPVVLKHYPTPLARTVFGREEHFRLLSGRLAHVPLNQLTSQLKSQARLKVWKLENARRITETIGPFEGFRLQYTLVRRQYAVQTPSGRVRRNVVELDRFVLVPIKEDLGQSVEAALTAGSAFLKRLRQLDPDETTITVWTYPDSFPDFRKLKENLHQRGYLTAARPLPFGYPIGGSPSGSKSAAQ